MTSFPSPVIIEWEDAQSIDCGLFSDKDLVSNEDNLFYPVKAYIIGFLVKETKDNYFLAKEFWESNQYKYLHIIPKRSVIKIIHCTEIIVDNLTNFKGEKGK